ncbi:MAG TPA: formylglycine-generating enzyme family protein [Vicinamibacterales bacterium]|nr:formylglycine-generating enzyme family protein [Vicinamibacterales bacterium]
MSDELLPRFAPVPAGEFSMGADDGDEDERPVHRVYVDAFRLSVHAITNQQFAEFVRAMGHQAPAVRDLPVVVTPEHELTFRELATPYVWRGGEMPVERARHPVTLVTFGDATAYCAWLTHRLGVAVRLPSEAEWERAARGNLDRRRYPWGDDIDPSRANFLPDPGLKRYRGTRPVGSYPPNAFALYDMTGNVWEWVADWHGPDTYREDDPRNPRGPGEGTLRIVRGGSWVTHDVSQLRCAHRHKVPADTYAYSIGFRVAYSEDTNV